MFSFLKLPREEIEKILRMLRNPRAPMAPRVVVAFLFLYIIWPVDLVPEAIVPIFGWADDVGLFGLTLWWLHKEVERLSQ